MNVNTQLDYARGVILSTSRPEDEGVAATSQIRASRGSWPEVEGLCKVPGVFYVFSGV
jgi:hypothetical protein